MSEGVKYDNDKPRWGLLPFKQVEEVVDVLTFGSKKYEDDNWKKVPNAQERYFDAMHRHIAEYRYGEKIDSETKKSHLAHAVCCILFQMWFDDNESNESKDSGISFNLKPTDLVNYYSNELKNNNPFESATFIHVMDEGEPENPFNSPQEGVVHNINTELEYGLDLTDCTHIPNKEHSFINKYVYVGSLCKPFKFKVVKDESLQKSVVKLDE